MATDTMRRTAVPRGARPRRPEDRPWPSGPDTQEPADAPGHRPAPHPAGRRPEPAPEPGRSGPPRQPRTRSPRMPFILLLVGLLGGALVSLLVISTTLAQGAFRITNLQEQNANLARQEQTLTNEVAQAGNPAVIATGSRAARHAAEPPPGLHRPENREDRHRQAVKRRGRDQRSRVYPVTPQDPTRRPQTNRRDDRRPRARPQPRRNPSRRDGDAGPGTQKPAEKLPARPVRP